MGERADLARRGLVARDGQEDTLRQAGRADAGACRCEIVDGLLAVLGGEQLGFDEHGPARGIGGVAEEDVDDAAVGEAVAEIDAGRVGRGRLLGEGEREELAPETGAVAEEVDEQARVRVLAVLDVEDLEDVGRGGRDGHAGVPRTVTVSESERGRVTGARVSANGDGAHPDRGP